MAQKEDSSIVDFLKELNYTVSEIEPKAPPRAIDIINNATSHLQEPPP